MPEVPSDFLPTKQVKLWKTTEKTKVSKEWYLQYNAHLDEVKEKIGNEAGEVTSDEEE